ncbi:MAG: FAD-binding domain-containing protein [Verrucomicrobiota bacterium]
MQVVWFKRDLRIHDHEALKIASSRGVLLPLYILEPELWRQPDLSCRHYEFLLECLEELDKELCQLGQNLIIKVGDAVEVLKDINKRLSIQELWSHQETWNGWTYNRDKKVKNWTISHGIPWHEPSQTGVIRRLRNRDGWSTHWRVQMTKELVRPMERLQKIDEKSDTLPSPACLGLKEDGCIMRQKGGRKEALSLLNGFLYSRGEGYTKEMSSPLSAFDSCSRLSAHLAFGTVSIREVFQASERRSAQLKELPRGEKGKWPSAMRSFSGRLRWHCHFIQKLEDEPRIEFKNMHSAYDGLREPDFNDVSFAAWKAGYTGYPMIDACMRALWATGWINFRMRAMLMSFASYHLWLHWREPSLHLARLFTDYEPGIHYSQAQMQAGTTGINSIRIYNPIKQGIDHDPQATFIRKWVPELESVPNVSIHTPWLLPEKMNGYPLPIVDEKMARKEAASKVYQIRKNLNHRREADRIVHKHGSRKSGVNKSVARKKSERVTRVQGVLEI